MADLCIWDWAMHGRWRHGARRWRADLHEKVFAWMTLGDERDLRRDLGGRREPAPPRRCQLSDAP